MTISTYKGILKCLKYFIIGERWQNHVYAVGGCCRDCIMGSDEIKDIDLVVDLPNGGIEFAESLYRKKLLARKPVTYPTYGTASFELAAYTGEVIEAVQTRAEKYPDQSTRNPVTVYGTAEQDCMRRDLTINAIYWDISNEKYVDFSGKGFNDIKNHVIRTPADPDVTYDDDPLRILRCARFSAKFMWAIDKGAFESMSKNAGRLSIISRERVRDELLHILDMPSANATYGIKTLCECGAMAFIMPINDLAKVEKVCNGYAWQYADNCERELRENIRMALLSTASAKWTQATDSLRLPIHCSGAMAKGMEMGAWLAHNDYADCAVARHFVKACASADVLAIAKACFSALTDGGKTIFESEAVNTAVADNWLRRKLPVGGNDLMAAGYTGRAVGEALSKCWDLYYKKPDATPEDFMEMLKSESKTADGAV